MNTVVSIDYHNNEEEDSRITADSDGRDFAIVRCIVDRNSRIDAAKREANGFDGSGMLLIAIHFSQPDKQHSENWQKELSSGICSNVAFILTNKNGVDALCNKRNWADVLTEAAAHANYDLHGERPTALIQHLTTWLTTQDTRPSLTISAGHSLATANDEDEAKAHIDQFIEPYDPSRCERETPLDALFGGHRRLALQSESHPISEHFKIKAVVVEEEIDYAAISAYALYRLGFDVRVVTRDAEIENCRAFNPDVIVTDLGFAPPDMHKNSFAAQSWQDKRLAERHRVLFSEEVGRSPLYVALSGDSLTATGAIEKLKNPSVPASRVRLVSKPHPGIHGFYRLIFRESDMTLREAFTNSKNANSFDLAIQHGVDVLFDRSRTASSRVYRDRKLSERAFASDNSKPAPRSKLLAAVASIDVLEFGPLGAVACTERYLSQQDAWLSRLSNSGSNSAAEAVAVGHAAYPMWFGAAQKILARAHAKKRESSTVTDWLEVAVRALDAKTLLCGRTPTLSLEALALQYEAEVHAECLFIGVDQCPALRERLAELDFELTAICCMFDSDSRYRSFFSTKISILDKLKKIYDEYGRYEEKQLCADQLREAKRKHTFTSRIRVDLRSDLAHDTNALSDFKRWASWLFWPVRWYFETLLSYPLFFVVVMALLCIFGFVAFGQSYYDNLVPSFALGKSIDWEFAGKFIRYLLLNEVEAIKNRPLTGWSFFAVSVMPILMWLHLGAFIALLTTRRQRS